MTGRIGDEVEVTTGGQLLLVHTAHGYLATDSRGAPVGEDLWRGEPPGIYLVTWPPDEGPPTVERVAYLPSLDQYAAEVSHSADCWRWHQACAVAEVERLREEAREHDLRLTGVEVTRDRARVAVQTAEARGYERAIAEVVADLRREADEWSEGGSVTEPPAYTAVRRNVAGALREQAIKYESGEHRRAGGDDDAR